MKHTFWLNWKRKITILPQTVLVILLQFTTNINCTDFKLFTIIKIIIWNLHNEISKNHFKLFVYYLNDPILFTPITSSTVKRYWLIIYHWIQIYNIHYFLQLVTFLMTRYTFNINYINRVSARVFGWLMTYITSFNFYASRSCRHLNYKKKISRFISSWK